jgi:hypothetical protein
VQNWMQSERGRAHAAKRHALTAQLKQWAIDYDDPSKPATVVADSLLLQLPARFQTPEFRRACTDPGRVMADALRSARGPRKRVKRDP